MRTTHAWLGLIVLLAAAADAAPLRNNHADCINGCWRSYEYCKQNQSKKIDCESQLGLCFDFCDDVYLPPMRSDIGGAPPLRDGSAVHGRRHRGPRGPLKDLLRRQRSAREAERFLRRLALDSFRRKALGDGSRGAERAAFAFTRSPRPA